MPSFSFLKALSKGVFMQENSVKLQDLIPVIEEILSTGGEFRIHPQGVSMLPYLKEGRDSVMLSPLDRAPKRGDILLYRRTDGTLVLHRVVRVEEDGNLSMRGDNQYFIERGIRQEQVIATVKRFYRGERECSTDAIVSRLYRARRTLSYPFRRVLRALLRRVKRLMRGKA